MNKIVVPCPSQIIAAEKQFLFSNLNMIGVPHPWPIIDATEVKLMFPIEWDWSSMSVANNRCNGGKLMFSFEQGWSSMSNANNIEMTKVELPEFHVHQQ
jgi:hypothetical protein